MIELRHTATVPALEDYLHQHPDAATDDFDSLEFHPVKQQVRATLSSEQGGLCVYCEQLLAADTGQVEHIKPKSGPSAHPELAFVYTNYAHSCINNKTCGQKKKAGLLPIEPGPGCNHDFILLTDGQIAAKSGLT